MSEPYSSAKSNWYQIKMNYVVEGFLNSASLLFLEGMSESATFVGRKMEIKQTHLRGIQGNHNLKSLCLIPQVRPLVPKAASEAAPQKTLLIPINLALRFTTI